MGSLKVILWIVLALFGALIGLWSYGNLTIVDEDGWVIVQGSEDQPLATGELTFTADTPAGYPGQVSGSGLPSTMASASVLAARGFYFERFVATPVDMTPEQVVVGDVTGDRRPDIVVTLYDWEELFVRIYEQNMDGTLAAPLEFRMPIFSGKGGALELVDLDGDGQPEITVGVGNGLTVFKRSGNTYTRSSFNGNVRALSLGAIDVDGDGYRDVFAQAWDEGADLYLSDRIGGFRDVQRLSTPLAGYNTLEISDFTADGIADAVMTNGQGWSKVVVYPAVASGGLLTPIEISLAPVQTWPALGVTVADIDRDGRPDLVVPEVGNALKPERGIRIYYRGNGNEIARHQFLQFGNMYQRPGAVQVADVDGNGYPDIVAMLNSADQMAYILQGPDGFGEPVFQSTDDKPWTNNHYFDNSFVIADVNSDRCPDIVLAELSSSLRIFYGRNCLLPSRHTGGPLPPRRG
jgi:hypothetical protein